MVHTHVYGLIMPAESPSASVYMQHGWGKVGWGAIRMAVYGPLRTPTSRASLPQKWTQCWPVQDLTRVVLQRTTVVCNVQPLYA